MTASRIPREVDDLRDGAYEFVQGSPATVWTIPHNLDRHPLVAVWDTAGTFVIGSVEHLDTNTLRITFSAPFAGTVRLI